MGALIQTKGTKLLAAHFNEEFSTYIDFYRDPSIKALFNSGAPGYTNLYDITGRVKDPSDPNHTHRTDRLTLLPFINPGDLPAGFRHTGLELRWLWWLQHGLSSANDQAIAAGIFTALDDTSYSNITFSCVEGNAQAVAANAAHDGATKYQQIVLTTPVMTTGSPAVGVPSIDQPNN